MKSNGSEKAFCMLTFHECQSVTIVQRQFRTYRAPVSYVTITWSVVLLNKKCTYCYLRCIVYDKLLKPRQSFWINLYFSEEPLALPRCRNPIKTPCITKRVPLQLCSLLRHRKFRSLYKWSSVLFLYFSTFQVLLLILCSLLGNTRDVTAKQMDGSLPIP
jgi:hypothetical protein